MMKTTQLIKLFFSFFIFWAVACEVIAQSTPIQLGVHYRYYAKGEVIDTLGSTRFKGTEIGHSEIGLVASVATPISKKTNLLHTLDYTLYQFSYHNWNNSEDPTQRPDLLHALNYQLGFHQMIGTSWKILLDVKPGIATSFQKDRSASDFILQGALQLRKYFGNEQQNWLGVGATLNTLLGEYTWLPVLSAYWQSPSQQWGVALNLPLQGELTYAPIEKFKLGLIGRVTGNQFSFHSPVADNFRLNATHGGALLRYNLFERIWLQIEGGLIINRTYEAAEGDRIRSDFDPDKFTPFYLQLQVFRTFGVKDKE